jgi:glycosyltransferase involved in cell wall biosynthesis
MKHIQKLTTRNGNKGTIIKAHQSAIKPVESKAKIVINKVEIPQPLINILTRTSGRPLGFKRCHESVKNQTYKNVRHIVSIDNLQDEEYVKECGVDYFLMDKDAISKEADIPDPKTGPRFIYNLYLNKLIEKVNDGWIIILDDDDYLTDNNVLQKVANIAKSNTDMLLWQMKYPNGGLLPSLQELGKPPRLARIGMPCFAIHSGIAKTIKFDGWKCGDFRFIQKVWAKTVDKRVIMEALVSLGSVGLGQRNDIGANINSLNRVSNNPSEINGNAIVKLLKQNEEHESNSYTESEKQFIILSVGWNVEKYLHDTYNSLKSQKIKNWKWFILDDNSTDNSFKLLQNIAKNDSRLHIFKNKEKMGAAYSRFFLLNQINELDIDPIIVVLDSDDMLSSDALEYLNLIYNNPNTKITFGNHTYLSGKKYTTYFYNKDYFKNKKIPKNEKFGLPHLRTFKKSISKNLKYEDFKDENGIYYLYCTDVILFLLLLKNVNPENIEYINKYLYIYRDNRNNNTLSLYKFKKNELKEKMIKKIYG